MLTTTNPSVVLNDLSFAWPDGTPALTGITAAFDRGRTGLIGDNGAGKSTLLRLIAGDLTPAAGTVSVSGQLGYLPQHLTLRTGSTVADLLGITDKLSALRSIESGDVRPELFDVLGDDWDIPSQGEAALRAIGLAHLDFDRPVGALSGGETVLTAFAGLQLAKHDVVLLDEPTNNLDRQARQHVYDAIAVWPGTLIVVSHDVTLLNLMDHIAELHHNELTTFGGNFDAYRDYVAQEQQAAVQALRTAEQQVKKEQKQRIEAQTKLARRERSGRNAYAEKREPKLVMGLRKSAAQVSAGKLRDEAAEKVAAAQEFARQQAERVRDDDTIRLDLPDPQLPASRRLAELQDQHGNTIYIEGPERVALLGRNGVGKTRLLEALVAAPLSAAVNVNKPNGGDVPTVTAVRHAERIGYLPQRLNHMDDGLTVLAAVQAAAPNTPLEEIRAQLARFLFRKDAVFRRVGDLSGGERFRVALAQLLLADPPNQLLILDEPTNNLDLRSVEALVSAMAAYRGALLVVSHDDEFLKKIGIDYEVNLIAKHQGNRGSSLLLRKTAG